MLRMNEPLVVSEKRFLDAGEQRADGLYDYYYSGRVVTLDAADIRFNVVIYDDKPSVATFKGMTKGGAKAEIDPADPVFKGAVEYLVAHYKIDAVSLYQPEKGSFETRQVTELFR
jgi:hypothetical protein